jgi:hypothetical protein
MKPAPTAAAGVDPRAVLDAVGEDPKLLPEEKETALHFSKRDDTVQIVTYERGLARRLLVHPSAEQVEVTVADGDGRPRVPLEAWDGAEIVGVAARLPIGALGIKSSPRKSTQHAPVISGRVLERRGENGGEA